jgi:hypothetical protein
MTGAKTIPAAWIGILLIGACDDRSYTAAP